MFRIYGLRKAASEVPSLPTKHRAGLTVRPGGESFTFMKTMTAEGTLDVRTCLFLRTLSQPSLDSIEPI